MVKAIPTVPTRMIGKAQTHIEMRDIMNKTATPSINAQSNTKNKPIINRRRRSKRKSVPHDAQCQRAQIQERQNHRFTPTGWPQVGQQ